MNCLIFFCIFAELGSFRFVCNAAVSNHRNRLARCVVSRDISDVFSTLTRIFTFNGIIMILARP